MKVLKNTDTGSFGGLGILGFLIVAGMVAILAAVNKGQSSSGGGSGFTWTQDSVGWYKKPK